MKFTPMLLSALALVTGCDYSTQSTEGSDAGSAGFAEAVAERTWFELNETSEIQITATSGGTSTPVNMPLVTDSEVAIRANANGEVVVEKLVARLSDLIAQEAGIRVSGVRLQLGTQLVLQATDETSDVLVATGTADMLIDWDASLLSNPSEVYPQPTILLRNVEINVRGLVLSDGALAVEIAMNLQPSAMTFGHFAIQSLDLLLRTE